VAEQGWCLVETGKHWDEQWESASVQAAQVCDFVSPKVEFVADLLGLEGSGKIANLGPKQTRIGRRSLTSGSIADVPGWEQFSEYRDDILSLFEFLRQTQVCYSALGFNVVEKAEGLLWMPYANRREESLLQPTPLTSDDVIDGLVERHLHLVRRRRLSFMYFIDTDGGSVSLYKKDCLDTASTQIPVSSGMLLVFRCDNMIFKYIPDGRSLVLLDWALGAELADVPLKELQLITDVASNDELLSMESGPPRPTGDRVRVTSLACRSAAKSNTCAEKFHMISSGTDAGIYVPHSRFDTDIYFSKLGVEDYVMGVTSYHHHAGLCADDDMLGFDNKFFGYSDEQANVMCPKHRVSLEVGYECLYAMGLRRETLTGMRIGVYVGDCGTVGWEHHLFDRMYRGEGMRTDFPDYTAAILCSRISFQFGLRGPVVNTDTACSSGLAAFVAACDVLASPTDEQGGNTVSNKLEGCLPMAGQVIATAGVHVGNSAGQMLSEKGRCFTFNDTADGYAKGEGIFALYCRWANENDECVRLQEKVCILGAKSNQDGRSATITAPNGPAQTQCLQASVKMGGISAGEVDIEECHGTGTALGDPIEIGAFRAAQLGLRGDSPIIATSLKSNIGHLEDSAGIGGLAKCCLCLMKQVLPPNVHMRLLNPHLDITGFPVNFSTECTPTSKSSTITSVVSFGFGGTNCNAVTWGRRHDENCKTRQVDPKNLDQLCITCPVTLARIDYLTGEPVRSSGGGWQRNVDVLRDPLAPYNISRYAYKGGFRYRAADNEKVEDAPVFDDRMKVYVCGSWTGWQNMEEMIYEGDGWYVGTMALRDCRRELFKLCVNRDPKLRFYPVVDNATPNVWIEGPDGEGEGRNWLVDGRDHEIPAGTCYRIRFRWGETRKQLHWEEAPSKDTSLLDGLERANFVQGYSIVGSWTSWEFQDLLASDHEGVWECDLRIGVTGEERFHFVRDRDRKQTIYPSRRETTRTTVPIRGPDDHGSGKYWVVRGAQGERMRVRLEVLDGRITIQVNSACKGAKVWKSAVGWARHEYFVVGSWDGWKLERMEMDEHRPGVFRCCGFVHQDWSDAHRGFVGRFYIVADEDREQMRIYPEVGDAQLGEAIIYGPGADGENRKFLLRGSLPGETFEISLDLAAEHRQQTVMWRNIGGSTTLPCLPAHAPLPATPTE